MDKAFIGKCRIGYGRIGVSDPKFDESMNVFKNQPASQGIIGSCTIGSPHRIGVQIPTFDKNMDAQKNQPARSGGGKDPAVAGKFRAGMWRAGVTIPVFDEIMERSEHG